MGRIQRARERLMANMDQISAAIGSLTRAVENIETNMAEMKKTLADLSKFRYLSTGGLIVLVFVLNRFFPAH